MNSRFATTMIVGALLAPVAGYAADKSMMQSAKESVSDSTITAKIKADFAKDRVVSATSIKVDTEDKGIVTLAGHAKSKAEADQAVKIARDTNGVISVKNNIVVGDAADRTGTNDKTASGDKSMTQSVKENVGDAVITAKIKGEFAKDKTVSAMHIKVETDNKGVVTLSGNAKSKAESDQAARLAHDTKGVTSVKNEIAVAAAGSGTNHVSGVVGDKSTGAKESMSDAMITTRIKAEFAKDKTVSAMSIKVDTDDKGVVTLSGNAKSKAEADQAVTLARNTKGVTSVKTDITMQAR